MSGCFATLIVQIRSMWVSAWLGFGNISERTLGAAWAAATENDHGVAVVKPSGLSPRQFPQCLHVVNMAFGPTGAGFHHFDFMLCST